MKPVAEARDLARAAGAHARAAGRLLATEADHVRAVHLARRHIKRARSLLRALRPLAKPAVERENGFLRAFAHTLAPLRDAHALEEAARTVGARGNGPAGGERIDLAALGRALERQARVIARLAPEDAPKHYLAKAVARAYRKAREAYRTYEATPHEEEPLHEARKRIKDCLHLVEALEEVRPRGSAPKPGKLDRLGELMGAIRDLDLLSRRIERNEVGRAKLARIAARHGRLAREVTRVGAAVFDEKPSRVEAAWRRSGT